MSQAQALVLIEEFEPVINETNATTGIIQTNPVTGETFESKVFRVDLSNTLDFLVRGVTRLVAIVAEGFAGGDIVEGGDIPCATILDWGGAPEEVPAGWLLCDGSEVSQDVYAGLYEIVGERYGTGAPPGTFFLPDLMSGRLAKGGNPTGGGIPSNFVSLGLSQLPTHDHGFTGGNHQHTVPDPSHVHGITQNDHIHTTPDHDHDFVLSATDVVEQCLSTAGVGGAAACPGPGTTFPGSVSVNGGQADVVIDAANTGIAQTADTATGGTVGAAGDGNGFSIENSWVGTTKMIKAC